MYIFIGRNSDVQYTRPKYKQSMTLMAIVNGTHMSACSQYLNYKGLESRVGGVAPRYCQASDVQGKVASY